MRGLTIIASAAVAIVMLLNAPRAAHAQWCAYYEPMIYNCGFRTFAQCLATISGVGGVCSADRRAAASHRSYDEASPAQRRTSKKRRRAPARR